ncbi:50S ribosomal protein L10 [Candidatus Micrarchaeota archaeon]|nr:50S ribosomal protein L10 [Candidatus Micrarchaeota archaeon]
MLNMDKKIKIVAELQKKLDSSEVVAVASIKSLPSKQYGAIKKKTRGAVTVSFARLSLIRRAIEQSKRKAELKPIEDALGDGCVLLFSSLDAFKLYKLFKQNKSKTGAKPGAIAPSDLIVPAGETNLAPGPVLTELKQAGIQAKIQGPKVVITKDAVVTKKGQPVSESAAKILNKLGVEPFEVGLLVQKVYDHGTLYDGDALNIDEDAILAQLVQAHQEALNVAVFAEIYNDVSTPVILQKAEREALALQKIVESKAGAPSVAATEAATPSAPAA